MKHGNASESTRECVMEFFQEDGEGEWSSYQFEHCDDADPIFAAHVTLEGGMWHAEIDDAYWTDEREAMFDDMEEAMEWCASWAWCPEAGQGEEGER